MFSRAELEFLKGETTLNSRYRRFLKHAVSKKLYRFETEPLPAILENDETKAWFLNIVSKFSNSVRENSNSGEAQDETLSRNDWWGCPDLDRSHESPSLVA